MREDVWRIVIRPCRVLLPRLRGKRTDVFEGVAFFDEDIEAAAGVALILGKDAAELR